MECFNIHLFLSVFFTKLTSVFDCSEVSYFLNVYLCLVMLPGFLLYVLLITATCTWALVVGNGP